MRLIAALATALLMYQPTPPSVDLLTPPISPIASSRGDFNLNIPQGAIVQVRTEFKTDEVGVCTAFAVRYKGKIVYLTAAHCFKDAKHSTANGQQVVVLKMDEPFDLAAFSVLQRPKGTLALAERTPDQRRDPAPRLMVVGFTKGTPLFLRTNLAAQEGEALIIYPSFFHGQSGAPIFDVNGRVVSMVQRTGQPGGPTHLLGLGPSTELLRQFLAGL